MGHERTWKRDREGMAMGHERTFVARGGAAASMQSSRAT